MKQILSFILVLISVSLSAQFQLNGVATNSGGGIYQLTPAVNTTFGAIWYKLQHNLNNNFNVQGQLNFGSDLGGADGITFVMQNSCLAAGGGGGGIGYSGIPGQSIGIEFDTYQNIAGTGSELNNDPTFDHLAVEINGDVVHDGSANDITAPVQIDPSITNVKTGAWYDFQISYNATSHRLLVVFNGSTRVDMIYDIKNNVFGGNQWVYWGFTSATGGHNNVHQVSINNTFSTHLLNDTTICTGSIPVTLNPFTNLRGTNLALSNPVVTSAGPLQPGNLAVDGNLGSRWESAFSDPQWMYVDLQSPTDIDSVVLYWEGAYATGYEIQTSNDAVTWTTRFSTTTGDGGKDKIVFSTTNIRYVRMYGTVRGTGYGYSLWEFQIYGQPHYLWSTNNGTNATISPDIYSSSVTLTPTTTTTYSVLVPDVCLGFITASMTVTISCSLPVELLNFSASQKANQTTLHWRTNTEKNCSHFEVWKSEDGIHYYLIGTVTATNRNSLSDYSFVDSAPITSAYYKLTVVDGNNDRSESQVVSLSANQEAYILNSVFTHTTQLIVSQGNGSFEVGVFATTGQYLGMIKGSESIEIGHELPSGSYLLQYRSNKELRVFRIIKM